MKIFGMSVKDRLKHIYPILFICMSFLSLVSIVTIFGAVDNFGKTKLVMQIAMTLLGIIVLLVVSNLDYRFFIDRFGLIMLIVSVFLLVITFFFGSTGENIETANKSWLRIPILNIAIQPSEFIKITFICTFAKHIELVKDKINHPKVF